MYLGPGLKSGVMGGRGRGGKKPFVSPAKTMWGADFELWGGDCPLEAGEWIDRIGGKIVTCVGSGDWFLNADGFAGVTKADVCYGLFSDEAAQMVDPYRFSSGAIRTFALISTSDDFAATTGSLFCRRINHTYGGSPYSTWLHTRPTGGTVPNRWSMRFFSYETSVTYLTNNSSCRPYPNVAGVPVLFAWAFNSGSGALWRLAAATNDWVLVNVGTGYLGIGAGVETGYSCRLFSRNDCTYDTSSLADTAARSFRFKSFAGGAGLIDPLLIKAWGESEGCVFV